MQEALVGSAKMKSFRYFAGRCVTVIKYEVIENDSE